MNIIQAMTDPHLFGGHFAGDCWQNWRALLSGFYGLPLSDDQLPVWTELTGRSQAPESAHTELWLVIGRRGGKSNIAALLAVYEAVFFGDAHKLAPGEVATILVIAADRKQARSVFRYVSGLLNDNPMLKRMIVREDKESIELNNRTVIEVGTASFRSVRGYSIACVIADEISFWRSEDSANPDFEIINALRPAMATLDGKLIALSSPYARRGALWDAHKRFYGKAGTILVAQAPSRTMNPTLPEKVVTAAIERDPAAASAEYMAQFRSDIEAFIQREVVDGCTVPGRIELAPVPGVTYRAYTDPSGGAQDAFTLAISHVEGEAIIIDAIRSRKPPFSPEAVVDDFCTLLKSYRITQVTGDRFAGEWPREQFRKRGISYQLSDRPASDLFRDLLPLLNSGRVELPDNNQLHAELVGLERRTTRSGKDSISHSPGSHDDLANSVAGAAIVASMPQARPRIRTFDTPAQGDSVRGGRLATVGRCNAFGTNEWASF